MEIDGIDIRFSIVDEVMRLIKKAEPESAKKLIRSWVEENGHHRMVEDVLLPMMKRLNESSRNQSLPSCYVAARVARAAVNMLEERLPDQGYRGPIVLGSAEDDFHCLGRVLVSAVLRQHGWLVHDLGNDVTAEGFIKAAIAHDARVIGVSAKMTSTALNVRHIRWELSRCNLSGRIQLLVGGAVFQQFPDLSIDVNADAVCTSVLEAPALVEKLWGAATEQDRRLG